MEDKLINAILWKIPVKAMKAPRRREEKLNDVPLNIGLFGQMSHAAV